jgi:amidohydrolase
MTVAMGISLWIIENQTEISGKIRFLFQPAEEQLPGGSLDMIKGGAIDNVDNIVGYHVLPKMDAGKIGIRYGAMAATVEIIEITLTGDGGHTSRPHQTANLVLAQAHLIMELNETLSNNIDHRTPVVLAFGSIAGGDAINVIPGKINLRGTIRYLDPGIRQTIHDLIKGAIDRVEKSSGARITYSIPGRGPGIVNDDKTAELVIRSAGETLGSDNVEILKQSSMGGEDFGNYLEKVPGAYFRLGCSNGICKDVHTVNFDVNEICIPAAIEVLNQVITNYFLEDTKPL